MCTCKDDLDKELESISSPKFIILIKKDTLLTKKPNWLVVTCKYIYTKL